MPVVSNAAAADTDIWSCINYRQATGREQRRHRGEGTIAEKRPTAGRLRGREQFAETTTGAARGRQGEGQETDHHSPGGPQPSTCG